MFARPIFVSAAVVGLAASAVAQTADKLCEGVAAIVKSAAEPQPFRSLAGSNPPGMEAAHTCAGAPSISAAPVDEYDCLWIFPATRLPAAGASSIASRAKACLVPAWTAGPLVEDKGARVQRFTRTDSKVAVETIEAAAGAGHSARISVTVRR